MLTCKYLWIEALTPPPLALYLSAYLSISQVDRFLFDMTLNLAGDRCRYAASQPASHNSTITKVVRYTLRYGTVLDRHYNLFKKLNIVLIWISFTSDLIVHRVLKSTSLYKMCTLKERESLAYLLTKSWHLNIHDERNLYK